MTKYLSNTPFYNRPATKEYIENWDNVFSNIVTEPSTAKDSSQEIVFGALGIKEEFLERDPNYGYIEDNLVTYEEGVRNMRRKATEKLIRPKK